MDLQSVQEARLIVQSAKHSRIRG